MLDDSMEGGGRERLELVFHTESRTTLHAVITMDGVYAGFAWTTIWILSVDNVWNMLSSARTKIQIFA